MLRKRDSASRRRCLTAIAFERPEYSLKDGDYEPLRAMSGGAVEGKKYFYYWTTGDRTAITDEPVLMFRGVFQKSFCAGKEVEGQWCHGYALTAVCERLSVCFLQRKHGYAVAYGRNRVSVAPNLNETLPIRERLQFVGCSIPALSGRLWICSELMLKL
jgi:hypothetical protein